MKLNNLIWLMLLVPCVFCTEQELNETTTVAPELDEPINSTTIVPEIEFTNVTESQNETRSWQRFVKEEAIDSSNSTVLTPSANITEIVHEENEQLEQVVKRWSKDQQNETSVGVETTLEPIGNTTEISNSTVAITEEQVSNSTESSHEKRTFLVMPLVVVNKVSTIWSALVAKHRVKPNSCNHSCENGVCDEYSERIQCICLVDFAGDKCETKVQNHNQVSLFDQVMNGKFDVAQYVCQFSDSKMIDDLENNLEVAMNVSYEEFVAKFVNDLWSEVNKEGWWLNSFEFVSLWNQNMTSYELTSLTQKLKFYSRVVYMSFETRVEDLERVLDHFVDKYQNTSMKLNAIKNIERAHGSEIEDSTSPIEVHNHTLVKSNFYSQIKQQFNTTYLKMKKLYKRQVDRLVHNETHSNYTHEQIEHFFQQLQNSTLLNWQSVVAYGSEYLSYKLSGNQVVMSGERDERWSLPGFVSKRSLITIFQVYFNILIEILSFFLFQNLKISIFNKSLRILVRFSRGQVVVAAVSKKRKAND
jgi:hypothetical protein